MPLLLVFSFIFTTFLLNAQDQPRQFSGIYPHLSFFNNESECGTGAVVSFADRLWAVTYAPHSPTGSSDKLYEIDKNLNLVIREESIGGTPANRMIHRESNQLFIGPYAIDHHRNVRTIPYSEMFGRPTGNARHLTDPAHKIYYATMEEGFYEVDVSTLEVNTLFYDEQQEGSPKAGLPGYHGKGFYSGQGRVIYANNGEKSPEAKTNPFITSGALSQWNGKTEKPEVILRNQFTEVTGPGGIYGSERPATDPVWSIGWDARSLILMCLDQGKWHRYRLPKASHSYDGAHGWNTEWPRIREIGEGKNLLMTMHGMFWNFPKTFSASNTSGISPRSSYLKVVGDFTRWGDHVVLGCDDTARSEFLNKRKAKGRVAAPQSQSNLWFVPPAQLDHFGPIIGRGAVWLNDQIEANTPSDPFLFAGFKKRAVHLSVDSPAEIMIEIDRDGSGNWEFLRSEVFNGYRWIEFSDDEKGIWIRFKAVNTGTRATAWLTYGDEARERDPSPFQGLTRMTGSEKSGGIVRARDGNKRTLHFASEAGLYTLDENARLIAANDEKELSWLKSNAAIPDRKGVIEIDEASVLYIDDKGKRFRLPKGDPAFDKESGRLCREVATERDLFNCHGTFYELPAENALGFCRVRPISSHQLQIADYCSYRGLLVLSGVNLQAPNDNPHIVQSNDGKAALWLGAIDDLWSLGKPVGHGGPWNKTQVQAGIPSDPYLMTGYDKKSLTLLSQSPAGITIEVDITGNGDWVTYRTVNLSNTFKHQFPDSFQAYWIRFTSDKATELTAELTYQ